MTFQDFYNEIVYVVVYISAFAGFIYMMWASHYDKHELSVFDKEPDENSIPFILQLPIAMLVITIISLISGFLWGIFALVGIIYMCHLLFAKQVWPRLEKLLKVAQSIKIEKKEENTESKDEKS